MRNYSIYTLKTKLEFTNLYQYLSEKDYKQLEQQILCHSYHTPICTSGIFNPNPKGSLQISPGRITASLGLNTSAPASLA